ncbi:glucose dehydrogenase [FAD, quinone]-like [Sitodiplosis mosellana]|uniref:glucose dehydrogenase [FAD, quinone]-like n=1 Tax=Sitodiplosis mosellana TaxID=263140 RepID=UPI0024444F2D|nr:glucose dehydrogenase [FAD, quinone]-like [Sitodiplosis mosellana]XP_055306500.1 glucose dehydrogenase [FAD, quinone]-like [Sitodiplosis mosellana]
MSSCTGAQCTTNSLGSADSMFASLVSTILAAQCALYSADKFPENYANSSTFSADNLQFDFIVVGSGAGGSVVASRLSENPDHKVLLIEAGGDPPFESEAPGLYGSLVHSPVDYLYSSYATRGCLSNGGLCQISRGKMLGGTTSLNGLYYSRGNRDNYDTWAANGCDGWDYDSVLPYFKKSEHNLWKPFLEGDSAQYHNGSGPMKVSFLGNVTSATQLFIDAAVEKNVNVNLDPNGATQTGIASFQFMGANGRRESTVTAFINPVQNRTNLFVLKNSYVTKVLIDGTNTATGVEFDFDGDSYTAYASKEVILSAGVIESPKLLMLSGVGPADQLEALDITVKKDLPVGENLQDHVTVLIFAQADGVVETSPTDSLDYTYQWAIHNSGPYAEPLALASFLNTDPTAAYPNHENIYFTFAKDTTDLAALLQVLSLNATAFKAVLDANVEHDILGTFIYYSQPKSRGTLKLNGTNPYNYPIIDPNYFANETDLINFVKATKEQNSYSETQAFQKYNATPVRIPLEACDSDYTYDTDDYWKCYLHQLTSAGMHHVGTCRMGAENDPTAVVDTELRVKGINHLRVVDSSVIPYITTGHITAPTVMIAEKAADLIKETWANSTGTKPPPKKNNLVSSLLEKGEAVISQLINRTIKILP